MSKEFIPCSGPQAFQNCATPDDCRQTGWCKASPTTGVPFHAPQAVNVVTLDTTTVPALRASLADILARFESCIADGNGEIPGDRESIEQARALLSKGM
jgi:hypothetical protein